MAEPSPSGPVLDYASPREPEPKRPLPRGVPVKLYVLCLVGAVCLAIYPLTPPEMRDYIPGQSLPQIHVLRPGLVVARPLAVVTGLLLLSIAAVVLASHRRIEFGILLFLCSLAACIAAVVMGFTFTTFAVGNQIVAADGTTYCGVDTSFEKGHEVAIGRLVSSGPMYQTVDLLDAAYLGRSNDVPVVRPASWPASRSAIYATPDGRIACCFEASCYLVYDVPGRQSCDLHKLSPFLLLDATCAINAADEAAILAYLRGAKAYNSILPTEEILTAALAHPNPAVRASAGRMLKALKP